MKKLLILCIFSINVYADPLLNISYRYAEPNQADEGNENIQRDLNIEAKVPFYTSKDMKKSYATGLQIQDTYLSFDDPRMNNFDLLKVAIPLHGQFVLGKNVIVSSISIGKYGLRDDFDNADNRIQGQGFYLFGESDTKWILGAGFGDQFGQTQFFPVVGAIYGISKRSKLSIIFPQIKYDYISESNVNYNFTIQPVGSQWRLKKDYFFDGSKEADLIISGIQYSIGLNTKLNETLGVYANIGVVKDRKFEVTRIEDPAVKEDESLVDQFILQIGFTYL